MKTNKEKEIIKKAIPPYLPYRTLLNFLERLKVGLPNRIDRSIMPSMSGAIQSQLLNTLEYLHLINPGTGAPTEKLTELIHSEGAERQRLFKEILMTSYSFLFTEDFNLQRATSNELQECFTKTGVSGDTTRKCLAFFLKATKDAGIKLSPYIKKQRGPKSKATGIKRKTKQSQITKQSHYVSEENDVSKMEEIPWEKLLLSKFPSFDPNWPAEVQVKWFDMFKELMEYKKGEE